MLNPVTHVAHGRLINRCVASRDYVPGELYKQCSEAFWADGEYTGTCGDPCSFIMHKGGSAEPDWLTPEDFMKELRLLQKRCARWAD